MRTMKEEMDIDLQEEGLDRIYRVGNPKVCKEVKPKPMIIKLSTDVHSVVCKKKQKKTKKINLF